MENTDTEQNLHTPGFAQSALCFFGNLLIISVGLFVFKLSLHSLMFFCLIWTGIHARILGYHYSEIRSMMSTGITQALPAVYIFL
ncbi:MAG: Na+/H+ antiporter NhaC, partial [Gammaproteobacteria bacterium]|nr:Na+/H+ antiporter NhaC [Gammaproteobacteria bacterium]